MSVIDLKKLRLLKKKMKRSLKQKDIGFGILQWLLMLGGMLMIAGVVLFVGMILWVSRDLPDPKTLKNIVFKESSQIFDREDNLIYEIHGDERRTSVSINEISPYVIDAILAIEDDEFYLHPGFDWKGILRSAINDVMRRFSGNYKLQGGSTITQQFVKNAFLTRERTMTRKLKELILAMQVERNYTKNEILEMYLNKINFGSNVYGIEVAANRFFAKSAKDLELHEAAVMAAIPNAPTFFSPYGDNVDALMNRKEIVLARMRELNMISRQRYEDALDTEVVFEPLKEDITAPHFVMYVKQLLSDQFGEEFLEKGGLKIYTTLDPWAQEAAETAVKLGVEKNREHFGAENAGLVAISPNDGGILAMVGSRDFFDQEYDGQVNVTLSLRQPGSSIKPFAYAMAFIKGYAPSTILYDVKTNFATTEGETYEPGNYDGTYRGPVTMRESLAQSLNIPAVKSLYLGGLHDTMNLAREMGLSTLIDPDRYGLSLVLGGGEIRLLELVGAYSVFANAGKYTPINPFRRIEDEDGSLLYVQTTTNEPVIDEKIAYLVTDVLADNQARTPMFGWNNYLYLPAHKAAAKTGTTNEYRDAWTVGYTPTIAAGVWVGNNDNAPMKEGASGLQVAAPIWKQFMQEALAEVDSTPFLRPEGIVEIDIDSMTGLLPSSKTLKGKVRKELFAKGFNIPGETSPGVMKAEVCKPSGLLATEYCPDHLRAVYVYEPHEAALPLEHWQKPIDEWATENHYMKTEDFQNQEIIFVSSPDAIPTVYDRSYTATTAANAPKITIIDPVEHAVIKPGPYTVHFMHESKTGFKRVKAYFDGNFQKTIIDRERQLVQLIIPPSDDPEKEHFIMLEIYDEKENRGRDIVNVGILAE